MTDVYDTQNLRNLPVDLSVLAFAAESNDSETRTFVDRETGTVVIVLESSFSVADEYVSSLSSEIEVSLELVEQLAADNRLPAWQVDELADALRLALDTAGRYVQIEPRWSSEAFRDMQDFAWSLEDPAHQRRLDRTLGGKGSFRRFNDALDNMPEDIRRQWFAFRDARARADIVDWLHNIGIEPIDTPAYRGPIE